MSETPLADQLLDRSRARVLAGCLADAAGGPLPALAAAAEEVGGRPLSGRMVLLREALLAGLPAGWEPFEEVVRAALADPRLEGWMVWPVGEAVAIRALRESSPAAFEPGLGLLAALTPRFSSEFALRPFLAHDLDGALAFAARWARDPDPHVRRLASEGTRPNLPWGRRVAAIDRRPGAAIAVLDLLYRDNSEVVRRSAANHLNDISRLDPDLAVETARRWLAEPDGQTERVVRHALRSLVKQAHPGALQLRGFPPPDGIRVSGPTLDRRVVSIGEEVRFAFEIGNERDRPIRLAIDYVVHFAKPNGEPRPKVFKLAVRELATGEVFAGERRHHFRQLSTRTHHPGSHRFELQVNGRRFGATELELRPGPG